MRTASIGAVLAACAALAACRGGAPGGGPKAGAGRLVAERRTGERLLDAPARATYCARDSLLVLVALSEEWSGGLVMRGRFPDDSARTFVVHPSVTGGGSASVGFRAVTDSVEPALLASRGTVRLEPGEGVSGRFDVVAPPVPGTHALQYLTGAFRAVPVADSATTCGILPRTP